MKILVIEDERLLADSIRSMLERKGFQVECVYDGESDKESGSMENIQPGTFVTITVNGKGKVTYVLVSSQSFFGGRGFAN